jgi:outer membrane protein
MPRFLLLLAGTCLLFTSASPADDLTDIFKLAERQDPQFRSVEANYRAVAEQRNQAKAQLWLPSLRGDANTTWNRQDIELTGGFGVGGVSDFNSRGYGLSLMQPVYHYDRWVALEQVDDRIREAELAVAAERQDLMLRAADRYFVALAALDNLEFARAELTALSRQLEQTRQRFEVGLIAITDVQEAQAGYDSAVAQEIDARNLLDNALELLRELTGQYHHDLALLGESMPLIAPEPPDIDKWTDTALGQNLRLQQALAATEAAEQEIRRQHAGHFPTLDIVGTHGYARGGGRFGSTDTTASTVGVQLNVPIYEGGQVVSRTREAQYRHEEALELLEQQRRATIRQARNSYLGVVSGISQVQASKQAVVSNDTALTATKAGFDVGTRTGVDVVTAERELFRAKRDYARARYDYILDTLRLRLAAGTLSPGDMETINSWLESKP